MVDMPLELARELVKPAERRRYRRKSQIPASPRNILELSGKPGSLPGSYRH